VVRLLRVTGALAVRIAVTAASLSLTAWVEGDPNVSLGASVDRVDFVEGKRLVGHMSELIGDRHCSSLRLARAFQTSPEFWLNMSRAMT